MIAVVIWLAHVSQHVKFVTFVSVSISIIRHTHSLIASAECTQVYAGSNKKRSLAGSHGRYSTPCASTALNRVVFCLYQSYRALDVRLLQLCARGGGGAASTMFSFVISVSFGVPTTLACWLPVEIKHVSL